jgi:hypothetical protein
MPQIDDHFAHALPIAALKPKIINNLHSSPSTDTEPLTLPGQAALASNGNRVVLEAKKNAPVVVPGGSGSSRLCQYLSSMANPANNSPE